MHAYIIRYLIMPKGRLFALLYYYRHLGMALEEAEKQLSMHLLVIRAILGWLLRYPPRNVCRALDELEEQILG